MGMVEGRRAVAHTSRLNGRLPSQNRRFHELQGKPVRGCPPGPAARGKKIDTNVKLLFKTRRHITLHAFFRVAILAKGIDGILETVGGAILLFVTRQDMRRFVRAILYHELLEDPNDPIATRIMKAVAHLTVNTKTFAAAYLLAHGVVKLGLATAIWRYKLWAYPLAGIVLSLFAVYQLGRFIFTHSIVLLLLTAVDIFVIAMLPREYKRLSKMKRTARPPQTR